MIWFSMLVSIALGVVVTPYLSVIAFVMFSFSILFLQSEEVLIILFGLFPFANIFKLSPASVSLFTICEIEMAILFVLKKKLKCYQFFVSLILILYMLLFSFENTNFLTIIKISIGFLLVGFSTETFTKDGLKQAASLLALSTIAMLLLSSNESYLENVEKYFTDLDYYIDSTGHATETLRLSGFFGDPNYCAVLVVLVLSLLSVLYYYKGIGVEYWLYFVFLIPLGFLTYSKSYLLSVVLFFLIIIFFILFPKHKRWALVTIIGVGITLYLVVNGKIKAINMILERFGQGNITTGRTDLNKVYLQYIYNNIRTLCFGDGISADRFIGAKNNVHCIYIELLYKLGIIGTVIYIWTLVMMTGMYKKNRMERHFANYIPLLFFLLMFGFLAGVSNYALPFYLSIVCMSLNYSGLDSNTIEGRVLND